MGQDVRVSLRLAVPEDGPAVAALYSAARAAAVPAIPPPVHTPAEDLEWFGGLVADAGHECWLAEAGGDLVGFAIVSDRLLDHLYVLPGRTGEGIGAALLSAVQARRPDGLELWVFESNVGAQRFYARHGFTVVERTDGRDNEEHAPDLRLSWTPLPRSSG